MPASRSFVDSNVICYLFGADPAKAERAEALLAKGPEISVQVLAEVCNVASRKSRRTWDEIEEIITTVSEVCEIVPLTETVQATARAIAARTGYTIYDAQILAAAAQAGCAIVWSEDMQDGHRLTVGRVDLEIRNPFGGDHD